MLWIKVLIGHGTQMSKSDSSIVIPSVSPSSSAARVSTTAPQMDPKELRLADIRPGTASGPESPDVACSAGVAMPWATDFDASLDTFLEAPCTAMFPEAASAVYSTSATPLHIAITTGHEAVARMLLQPGADALRRDSNGSTALHLAAELGNESLVRLLLQAMDPDVVDYTRRTVLQKAVEAEKEEVVELLLSAAAADVNTKDVWGNSALHIAVKSGSERLTMLLLDHGADVDGGQ